MCLLSRAALCHHHRLHGADMTFESVIGGLASKALHSKLIRSRKKRSACKQPLGEMLDICPLRISSIGFSKPKNRPYWQSLNRLCAINLSMLIQKCHGMSVQELDRHEDLVLIHGYMPEHDRLGSSR
ncbi:hypothetical protein MRB53_037467 [Persea americana]|nr:hypothetical protein MRB53_037467 [Persea americana]